MFFNLKIAKSLVLASGALLLPATAHAGEKVSFERDGVHYVYTKTTANGRTVLKGTADEKPFRLVVGADRVAGDFNNRSIQFPLSEVEPGVETVAIR